MLNNPKSPIWVKILGTIVWIDIALHTMPAFRYIRKWGVELPDIHSYHIAIVVGINVAHHPQKSARIWDYRRSDWANTDTQTGAEMEEWKDHREACDVDHAVKELMAVRTQILHDNRPRTKLKMQLTCWWTP